MTWVITRLCQDCVDQSCIEVCPVECIYAYTGSDNKTFPNQLFIHPEECIDCGACEPQCTWEAIFEDGATPAVFKDDIKMNANMVGNDGEFKVPERVEQEPPTPEQVAANKKKWGYA